MKAVICYSATIRAHIWSEKDMYIYIYIHVYTCVYMCKYTFVYK